MEYRPDTVIYHRNCSDGFTSAWACYRRWPHATFIPYGYDDAPPTEVDPFIDSRHVLIVDFSFKRDVLDYLSMSARSIVVLDHHKTADAELRDVLGFYDEDDLMDKIGFGPRVFAQFDMNKSGARLSWEFAFPRVTSPKLIDYVEDRDIWRWLLPDSREINDYVGSFDFDFETWNSLADALSTPSGRQNAVMIGQALNRRKIKDIDSIIKTNAHEGTIDGFNPVMIANMPGHLASDAGNILCHENPHALFSATYYFDEYGRQKWSLRSNGFDVSEVAKLHGGGGHQKAAGFTVEKILTL